MHGLSHNDSNYFFWAEHTTVLSCSALQFNTSPRSRVVAIFIALVTEYLHGEDCDSKLALNCLLSSANDGPIKAGVADKGVQCKPNLFTQSYQVNANTQQMSEDDGSKQMLIIACEQKHQTGLSLP